MTFLPVFLLNAVLSCHGGQHFFSLIDCVYCRCCARTKAGTCTPNMVHIHYYNRFLKTETIYDSM